MKFRSHDVFLFFNGISMKMVFQVEVRYKTIL